MRSTAHKNDTGNKKKTGRGMEARSISPETYSTQKVDNETETIKLTTETKLFSNILSLDLTKDFFQS